MTRTRHSSLLVAIVWASTVCSLSSANPSAANEVASSSSADRANHHHHGSIGNHQMNGGATGGDAIDVSSSIGVSGSGEPAKGNAGHPGHVDDLIANESAQPESPKIVALGPMQSPTAALGSFPHASVLDSEMDLIQAESEPKFSLSKLKRPFTRLHQGFDSLRFNNRFLNGAASFLHPQVQPPHPATRQHAQVGGAVPPFRHGPIAPPNFPVRPHANFARPSAPHFVSQGGGGGSMSQPVFKTINMPQPQQQMLPPYQNGAMGQRAQMHISAPPQLVDSNLHVIEDTSREQASPLGSGNDANDAHMMHSISEFISNEEGTRQNDFGSLSELDNRQPLSTPSNDIWPLSQPELPKILHLDVKCEKNFMKVSVEFDRPYSGMIFSKGYFSSANCIHLAAGSGRTHVYFDIRMDSCGTTGNMASTALAPAGAASTGNYFENIVIFQYDPFVQEAWDQARKLRCTWHDQYEKSVSFRPFPVDMVDVVRADFAGDNVGCWMQIQVGRGPWASEVAGIVKIGQTMTMVLAIKDEENKFDMLVRNCVAHDGKRAPIELVDTHGCIVRSKLMSRFTKIKNFGTSASVLSYAHFQAFKFPDSMEVHFQCTIQICKHSCPEQCDLNPSSSVHYVNHQISGTINTATGAVQPGHQMQAPAESVFFEPTAQAASLIGGGDHRTNLEASVLARPREIRDVSKQSEEAQKANGSAIGIALALPSTNQNASLASKEIGLARVIRVVSPGDLSFATSDKLTTEREEGDLSAASSEPKSTEKAGSAGSTAIEGAKSWLSHAINERICMSSINLLACFSALSVLLLLSCSCSVVLCCRRKRAYGDESAGGKKSKKSAKESALTAKMVLGAQMHARSAADMQQTSSSSGHLSAHHNASTYLGSSSVLSPRVQAAGSGGGYGHHRTSDLYHS